MVSGPIFYSIAFYVTAALVVLSAFMVVWHKNPVVNAMYLVLCFFSVAVCYVMLQAHFLAAIQVLVYAGAILVLFVMIIMLINFDDIKPKPTLGKAIGGAVVFGIVLVLTGTLLSIDNKEIEIQTSASGMKKININTMHNDIKIDKSFLTSLINVVEFNSEDLVDELCFLKDPAEFKSDNEQAMNTLQMIIKNGTNSSSADTSSALFSTKSSTKIAVMLLEKMDDPDLRANIKVPAKFENMNSRDFKIVRSNVIGALKDPDTGSINAVSKSYKISLLTQFLFESEFTKKVKDELTDAIKKHRKNFSESKSSKVLDDFKIEFEKNRRIELEQQIAEILEQEEKGNLRRKREIELEEELEKILKDEIGIAVEDKLEELAGEELGNELRKILENEISKEFGKLLQKEIQLDLDLKFNSNLIKYSNKEISKYLEYALQNLYRNMFSNLSETDLDEIIENNYGKQLIVSAADLGDLLTELIKARKTQKDAVSLKTAAVLAEELEHVFNVEFDRLYDLPKTPRMVDRKALKNARFEIIENLKDPKTKSLDNIKVPASIAEYGVTDSYMKDLLKCLADGRIRQIVISGFYTSKYLLEYIDNSESKRWYELPVKFSELTNISFHDYIKSMHKAISKELEIVEGNPNVKSSRLTFNILKAPNEFSDIFTNSDLRNLISVLASGRIRQMEEFGTTATVGDLLFTQYILPFEISSFLLLAAIVGVLVLARGDKSRRRTKGEGP